ncbi:hypothetical protein TNCV_3809021 [Trichonephila clavipes]|nr:hypothetical protein TNCV_3809021 [Trichonephila clavipes]
MEFVDWYRVLFACKAVNRSSIAVFLGQLAPIFLAAVPMALAAFPSVRNDTLVDSEFFNYTGQTTLLLQFSDHSSTCKVVQSQLSIFYASNINYPRTEDAWDHLLDGIIRVRFDLSSCLGCCRVNFGGPRLSERDKIDVIDGDDWEDRFFLQNAAFV